MFRYYSYFSFLYLSLFSQYLVEKAGLYLSSNYLISFLKVSTYYIFVFYSDLSFFIVVVNGVNTLVTSSSEESKLLYIYFY